MKLHVPVSFRDLQPVDLDALTWSGGETHLRVLEETMQLSWQGQMVALVAELSNAALIAHGALDLRADVPLIWLLGVRNTWQGLGVGTALIAELARFAREAGFGAVAITVEDDNPRAKALYLRQGFAEAGSVIETWPRDDGRTYACVCTRLVKELA